MEHCGRVALDEEVWYLVWYLCPFYLDLRLTIGQPLHCNGLEERSPISNVKVAFSWEHSVVIWISKQQCSLSVSLISPWKPKLHLAYFLYDAGWRAQYWFYDGGNSNILMIAKRYRHVLCFLGYTCISYKMFSNIAISISLSLSFKYDILARLFILTVILFVLILSIRHHIWGAELLFIVEKSLYLIHRMAMFFS